MGSGPSVHERCDRASRLYHKMHKDVIGIRFSNENDRSVARLVDDWTAQSLYVCVGISDAQDSVRFTPQSLCAKENELILNFPAVAQRVEDVRALRPRMAPFLTTRVIFDSEDVYSLHVSVDAPIEGMRLSVDKLEAEMQRLDSMCRKMT